MYRFFRTRLNIGNGKKENQWIQQNSKKQFAIAVEKNGEKSDFPKLNEQNVKRKGKINLEKNNSSTLKYRK